MTQAHSSLFVIQFRHSLTAALALFALANPLGGVSVATAQIRIDRAATVRPANLQITSAGRIRHLDKIDKRATTSIDPSAVHFDAVEALLDAPQNVNISLEPKEGEYLVYELTPGFDFYGSSLAQLSVLAIIQNKSASQVDLDKVTIEYKRNGLPVTKNITLPSDQLKIGVNSIMWWQNSRDYHVSGDVVFLEAPFPTEATFKFYFKSFTVPLVLKKKLKAYTTAYDLPFAKKDLGTDEYWTGYSMHGGGDQVFAYDLAVNGYKNGWTAVDDDTDGTKNSDFRIWGKPVYAMADGYVLEVLNVCPNNGAPIPGGLSEAEYEAAMTEQKNKYWGAYEDQGGGAGNHLSIRHGSNVALYAHLQKGTISSKLLTKGAQIKKGELLGLAGNSGNSSGPHLHIHVKSYVDDDTPGGAFFRPLVFRDGFVIGQGNYASPKSNVAWSSLDAEGIPGLVGKACFIHPDNHPYCAVPGNHGEVSRHGIPAAKFQDEFDKIWTCGYYPIWVDGYDVGGASYFNLIFRPSGGVRWVARHGMNGSSYQTEFNKWDKEGYRLLTIDSYKKGNDVAYAAVWIKDGAPRGIAYHGATLAWHEQNFKANADKGYVPANVSCVTVGSATYVTALWEKRSVGGFYSRPAMTLQQYKDHFKDYSDTQKFKLVYLNAYTKSGVPMLSGIWYRNAPNYASWWAKHHLTPDAYQAEYTAQLKNGYMTRCVTGYADAGGARFEGIWSK